MTSGYPAFPEDPVASAVFDAYPPSEETASEVDLTTWTVEQLRELAVWNTAVLAENPAVEDVIGLEDEPWEPQFPDHNITDDSELDNPYDGSLD